MNFGWAFLFYEFFLNFGRRLNDYFAGAGFDLLHEVALIVSRYVFTRDFEATTRTFVLFEYTLHKFLHFLFVSQCVKLLLKFDFCLRQGQRRL